MVSRLPKAHLLLLVGDHSKYLHVDDYHHTKGDVEGHHRGVDLIPGKSWGSHNKNKISRFGVLNLKLLS